MRSHLEEYVYRLGYRVSGDGTIFNPSGTALNPSKFNSRGCFYFAFGVRYPDKDGIVKKRNCYVHRLQAYQKFGDAIYDEKLVVRHLNGQSLDNSFDNIGIGTVSDNMMDRREQDRIEHARLASSHSKIRFSKDRILQIKSDRKGGMSYNMIMKKYGISSKGTVSYICNHDYIW